MFLVPVDVPCVLVDHDGSQVLQLYWNTVKLEFGALPLASQNAFIEYHEALFAKELSDKALFLATQNEQGNIVDAVGRRAQGQVMLYYNEGGGSGAVVNIDLHRVVNNIGGAAAHSGPGRARKESGT